MRNLKKALIVDDSRSARFSLRKTLEKMDISVDCVESGENALSYLKQAQSGLPDIIFMDNLMPGMNGFSTSKTIHTNNSWSHIPIIMCTATDSNDCLDQAKDAGAIDVLSKPATIEQIDQILLKLADIGTKQTINLESNSAAQQSLNIYEPTHTSSTDTLEGLIDCLQSQFKAIEPRLTTLETTKEQIEQTLQQELETLTSELKEQLQTLIEQHASNAFTNTAAQALEERLHNKLSASLHSILDNQINQLKDSISIQLSEQIKQGLNKAEKQLTASMPSETAMIEKAKEAAQFIAAHKSVETAEEIAKKVAAQKAEEHVTQNIGRLQNQLSQSVQTQVNQNINKSQMLCYLSVGLSAIAIALVLAL